MAMIPFSSPVWSARQVRSLLLMYRSRRCSQTRSLLEENCCLDRVQLLHAGHEQLAAYVTDPVQAVIFNLGYLPGSDKSCITRPETTLAALGQAESSCCLAGFWSSSFIRDMRVARRKQQQWRDGPKLCHQSFSVPGAAGR